MEHTRRTGASILIAGVLLGALLGPSVAQAVASIVTIQGAGTTKKAAVTSGGQLQVAEATPSSFREFEASVSGDGACHQFGTIPSTKGFVVRSVVVAVITASSSGFTMGQVWGNASCSGLAMVSIPTKVVSDEAVAIEPGFGVAHNSHFGIKVAAGGSAVDVHVFGYLVPSGDVPSTTPVSG
jgi:hypothetical protein